MIRLCFQQFFFHREKYRFAKIIMKHNERRPRLSPFSSFFQILYSLIHQEFDISNKFTAEKTVIFLSKNKQIFTVKSTRSLDVKNSLFGSDFGIFICERKRERERIKKRILKVHIEKCQIFVLFFDVRFVLFLILSLKLPVPVV